MAPLSMEEERSLLKKLGYGALSGLATVGNILDTPGSTVRGMLSGEPVRALKGIVDPQERVYGREMLEAWDVLGPNQKGFDWGDVAGFGAAVLTDPLLGVSLGALGVGGRAVRAAGLLDDIPAIATAKRARVLGTPKQVLVKSPEFLKSAGVKEAGKRVGRIETTVGDAISWLKGNELVGGAGPAGTAAREATKKALGAIDDYAKQAGTTRAALMGERLGGVAGYGVPFMDPAITGGTGAISKAVARGMDVVGAGVARSTFGRHLTQLFSPQKSLAKAAGLKEGQGLPTAAGQELSRMAHVQKAQGTAAGRSLSARVLEILETAKTKKQPVDNLLLMRDYAEGFIKAPSVEIEQAAKLYMDQFKRMVPIYDDLGLNLAPLVDDQIGYWARYLSKPLGGKGGLAELALLDESLKKRKHILRGIPGSPVQTSTLMKLFQAPEVLGAKSMVAAGSMTRKEFAKVVKDTAANLGIPDQHVTEAGFKAWSAGGTNAAQGGIDVTRLAGKGVKNAHISKGRHKELASLMHDDLSLSQLEVGVFGNHPMVDAAVRNQVFEEMSRVVPSLYDGIAAYSTASPKGEGLTTVGGLLKNLGLRQTTNTGGAISHIARRLGIALPAAGDAGFKKAVKQIAQRTIPQDLADDVLRIHKAYSGGGAAAHVLPLADGFLNLWKVGVTAINPAFHSRNFVSALFRSYIDGTFSAGDFWSGWSLLRGGVVRDAHNFPEVAAILTERGISKTAENGTKVVRELVYAHNVASKHAGEAAARVGVKAGTQARARTLEGATGEFLGGSGADIGFGRVGKTLIGKAEGSSYGARDLTGVRGVGSATVTTNPIAKAGEEMGAVVEATTRIMPFINQLRKGTAGSSAAARRVALAQVDYSSKAFTAFERDVLKRIFPFYAFSSRNLAYSIRQLYEAPGGRMAQAIRAINTVRDPGSALPPHVGETAAIPIGEDVPLLGAGPDSDPRYLTGLGLMFEEATQFANKGAGMEVLSRMNPLLKAPLEGLTGQSFFQRGPLGGRELRDMDPPLGRAVANIMGREDPVRFPPWFEFLLSNSPLSRLVTTIRTLTDPRKRAKHVPMPGVAAIANVVTGLRITDVPISAQQKMIKDIVSSIIRDIPGSRLMKKFYVPEDVLAQMPLEEQEETRRLAGIDQIFKRQGAGSFGGQNLA